MPDAPPPPPPPPGPRPERRKFKRTCPEGTRVWLVSGEFEEIYTTVNFARRLLNLGPRGCCVETTGRLRSDVLMRLEIRFDAVNGSLRAPARAVWSDTKVMGGQETHLVGFRFEEEPELSQTVRDLLGGARATMIMDKRSRDYEDLKRKAEERKQAAAKPKRSVAAKLVLLLLLLVGLYAASFGALVYRGRLDAEANEVRFRYVPGGEADGAEKTLAAVYGPAYALARACKLPLLYVPP